WRAAVIERQQVRRRPDCPFIFHGSSAGRPGSTSTAPAGHASGTSKSYRPMPIRPTKGVSAPISYCARLMTPPLAPQQETERQQKVFERNGALAARFENDRRAMLRRRAGGLCSQGNPWRSPLPVQCVAAWRRPDETCSSFGGSRVTLGGDCSAGDSSVASSD